MVFGKLHKRVRVLNLMSQGLTGSLSPHMGDLTFLRELWLWNNSFVGTIPPEIGRLARLRFLYLNQNDFSGTIPGNLSGCSKLEELQLGNNKLVGTIPTSIFNLSLLSVMSMSDNQFTGRLPPSIGSLLPNLVILQLSNNRLSGTLPPSLSNSSKLRYLELDNNNISGKLTLDFSKLKYIERILLQYNLFGSGEPDEMKFIDSLTNCSNLQYLGLGNCRFQGVVPESVGNLSQQLQTLNLGANQLYGNVPLSVGNLVGLIALSLVENHFTGKIPYTIGMLQNLQAAFLYDNQFSGSIPNAFGNLSKLVILSLRANKLKGDIPPCLGSYKQLQKLELSNNKLSSKIPIQILQLPSLCVLLNLSRNNLFGSLPTEVGDLKMLSSLDLSYNNLLGSIPSSLGGCTSLSFLSLKGNLFQGTIPPSFSSLRGVMKLDLSLNKLSGEIPRFLERLSLQYLNLSFNNFEGETPLLGVFANASAFSVLGNSRLCGGLVGLRLPNCKKTKEHGKRFHVFLIAILIASTHFIILCLVYAWCKKKRKNQPSRSSMNEMFLKVSYNQLLKATDGFSEENLIGKGGFSYVYKGILDIGDGGFVAVKVLHLQNQGAHKSFTAECEAWRVIRHRNLLKIITSCSSIDFQGNDFKALVYEFMPNGSLHDWLHSSAYTIRLNLYQRLHILIDVASAIDYLHNQCLTTVIHGDLKPSNILLDKDMVAHVGDFGLTRFFGIDSYQNSSSETTRTTGTIGYAPPEYGLGSVMTTSGDVYSFGILLLEVMTGKKPTDDIFTEGLIIHKFASMALQDRMSNVVDDAMNVTQSTEANMQKMEACLASIFKIGVLCSMDSPSLRMNIEIVVRELKQIVDALQNI